MGAVLVFAMIVGMIVVVNVSLGTKAAVQKPASIFLKDIPSDQFFLD